jgi:apolipoprotein N-acyltransferase
MGAFGAGAEGGDIMIVSLLVPALAAVFALKITLAEFIARRLRRGGLVAFAAIWVAFDLISTLGNLAFPGIFSAIPVSVYPGHTDCLTDGVYGVTFLIVL